MPIPDWTVPFWLRSYVYASDPTPGGVADDSPGLPINQTIADFEGEGQGIYLLRQEGCSLVNGGVRMTKEHVPQGDGDILHRRFVSGSEITLAVQMWQTTNKPACDELLQVMSDTLMGYAYGLLNAGDNEGRVIWTPAGEATRMLDDCQLLSYPVSSQSAREAYELVFSLDSPWPYAMDSVQDPADNLPNLSTAASSIVNGGNRSSYPVILLYGDLSGTDLQTVTNVTTGEFFQYDCAQPGSPNIDVGGNEWLEIDMFKNTVYKVVSTGGGAPFTLSNAEAGIVMDTSTFFTLAPGTNNVVLTLGSSTGKCLSNSAWA
jgi:hypothetical protein